MTRDEFDAQVNDLLLLAETMIPEKKLPDLAYMQSVPTVPDWYAFEMRIWDTGEKIRQLIVSERKELNSEQMDSVCDICLDSKAKRGRQSFVMLLGKKRYSCCADKIATVLTDKDITGHVIQTLYKMGASQYTEQIYPYTNHSTTWIRNEAKRYINKFGTL